MYLACVSEIGDSLEDNLLQALESVRWREYVKPRSTVFVKPNFTFPYYNPGVTTNPELLRSLLGILRSRTDSVILGESDGGNRSWKAETAFRDHHMHEICKETGTKLLDLSTVPRTLVQAEIQSKRVKVELPTMLLEEVDCFISVPVLKVHAMTGISLSIKNLWGCYPDTMRCLYHQHLEHRLTLIAKVLNPQIVVIDGTYGLNRHGPMFGDPVPMDLIVTSNNPVVADALGAAIMGMPIARIKHVMMAEGEGLGTTDLEKVQISGDWERHRRQFYVRKTLMDRLSRAPFDSELIARICFASPLTTAVYKVVELLRSSEEAEVVQALQGSTLETARKGPDSDSGLNM